MKLGVVGHAAEKFTPLTEAMARMAIRDLCVRHKPTHIVSGRSPMGGVDVWAEDVAAALGIPTIIHEPTQHSWQGKNGFKARNLRIATSSDLVAVVVVDALPPGYTGMRFNGLCYHCRDRNPPHIKSGGCWTAWRCRSAEWVILKASESYELGRP